MKTSLQVSPTGRIYDSHDGGTLRREMRHLLAWDATSREGDTAARGSKAAGEERLRRQGHGSWVQEASGSRERAGQTQEEGHGEAPAQRGKENMDKESSSQAKRRQAVLTWS